MRDHVGFSQVFDLCLSCPRRRILEKRNEQPHKIDQPVLPDGTTMRATFVQIPNHSFCCIRKILIFGLSIPKGLSGVIK